MFITLKYSYDVMRTLANRVCVSCFCLRSDGVYNIYDIYSSFDTNNQCMYIIELDYVATGQI